jgi:nitrite reductase/ring-hydroxylating ferredoxin subunit
MHFLLFDIRTGAPGGGVPARRLRTVPVQVTDDGIYVDLSGLEETAS